MKNINKKLVLVYLSLFFLFYLINILTPLIADDYIYAFNFTDHSRISNIYDVFESQYTHYQKINGRLIPHIFEQIFAGITGKWLFNIINTFFILTLIFIISKYYLSNNLSENNKINNILLTAFAILFLFTYPGQTVFWMAGALNYLWPTVFALILLHIFKSKVSVNLFFIGFISLFAAWFQEAISIPMTCLFGILLLKKEYRNKKNIIITFFFTIGTCLIVFAPGTLNRIETNQMLTQNSFTYLITNRILNTFAILNELYIWIICLLIFLWEILSKRFNNFRECLPEWILWIICFLFTIALGYTAERITMLLSVISFILSIRYCNSFKRNINYKHLSYIIPVIFYSSSLYAINKVYQYNQWTTDIIGKIQETQTNYVILTINQEPKPSRLYYIHNLKTDNRITGYYNKRKIQVLSPQEYDLFITNNPEKNKMPNNSFINSSNIKLYTVNNQWMIELPADFYFRKISIHAYHEKDNSQLTKKQLFIRSILHTLDSGISEIPTTCILKNDKCYCYFTPLDTKELRFNIIEKISDNETQVLFTFNRFN
ncbi:MAG TPA: DUF6056 family protein [Bacteroidaceae bacterium]|nr:DUF6056 family protein [Bacteroidaceae bacterium]